MNDKKITSHHIIPRSRNGRTEKGNIAKVTHLEHDRYHQIFENKTPVEILHYLVTSFWGNKKEFLVEYLEEISNIDK